MNKNNILILEKYNDKKTVLICLVFTSYFHCYTV